MASKARTHGEELQVARSQAVFARSELAQIELKSRSDAVAEKASRSSPAEMESETVAALRAQIKGLQEDVEMMREAANDSEARADVCFDQLEKSESDAADAAAAHQNELVQLRARHAEELKGAIDSGSREFFLAQSRHSTELTRMKVEVLETVPCSSFAHAHRCTG